MGEGDARTALLNQYMSVTDPLFDELVDEGKVKSVLSEERVEKAFLEPPVDSRGVLRVALAREFRESIRSISWAYIKLLPKISYMPIEFNELDDWTALAREMTRSQYIRLCRWTVSKTSSAFTPD